MITVLDAAHEPNPPAAPADTDASAVLERLLMERRSCRAFLPAPVPDTVIQRMLTLAQRTASWCNVQPWEVVVTRGTGTEHFRSVLHQAAQERAFRSDVPPPPQYQGKHLGRRRETGFGMYGALGIERHDKEARRRQEWRISGCSARRTWR